MPMPDVGSSRKMAFGFAARAMPTSSRRCWPCERLPAGVAAWRVRPTRSSTWATVSAQERGPVGVCQQSSALAGATPWAARRRFSRTGRVRNRLVTWKERAMPRRTRRWSGSRVTSWPSNRMRPPLTALVPVSMWNSVVLPAPLGPITECTVLARTFRSTPPRATNLP